MRKDFCEFLLDAIPFLREYGNIEYKFSDTVVVETSNSDADISSSSVEMVSPQENLKTREKQKPVASALVLDIPD